MTPGEAPRLPAGCRRLLVTGASGFVGGHLLALLAPQAAEGRLTILRAGREKECDLPLDLADPATIVRAVRDARPDAVVHLAGEASVASAARAAALTWRNDLFGTLALAEALGEVSPAATLLFTSSAEVYGTAYRHGPADEDTPPEPNAVYSQLKLAAEHMLAAVLPTTATLIIVRPSNHIGPGQHDRFAMPSFARQLVAGERAGRPIELKVGNLATERDFLDVRDVVRAYAGLLAACHGSGARARFNVASGEVRSVGSLLDLMRGEAQVESTVTVDPALVRPIEVPRAEPVPRRLAAATGWRAEIPLEQTLCDILADMRLRG